MTSRFLSSCSFDHFLQAMIRRHAVRRVEDRTHRFLCLGIELVDAADEEEEEVYTMFIPQMLVVGKQEQNKCVHPGYSVKAG
jgi:hypothetical protein